MKNCVLHIGIHKTGSSSIQKALQGYDDGATFYANLGVENHSIPLYTAFRDDAPNYHYYTRRGTAPQEVSRLREVYLGRLHEELARENGERIIFSAEEISLFPPDVLDEFLRVIDRYCESVEVVAYVRDPVGFAASWFAQSITMGATRVPKVISPEYRARLEKFLQFLPKESIHVRRYPVERDDGDTARDFFQLLGLDMDPATHTRVNVSPTSEALKALFLFNRTSPLLFSDERLLDERTAFVSRLNLIFEGTGKVGEGLFFERADFSECEWLKDTFGIDFAGPDLAELEGVSGAGPQVDKDLSRWSDTFSPDFVDRIQSYLAAHGLKEMIDPSPMRLVHRLFFLTLEEAQPKSEPPTGNSKTASVEA